jgi:ComF family protein
MEVKKDLKMGVICLADIFMPRTCIVCGCRLLRHEMHLCMGCLMDMPLTRFWERSHNPMADKFNEIIQKGLEVGAAYEPYAYATALFLYHSEAGYRQIPYQIKYMGNTDAGTFFGSILGKKLITSTLWNDVDMIIPVPLHWTRQWKRGYNQAEVIASALAREMDVPMRTDILVRSRRTRTQTKLDIDGKARNVAGAFAVSEDAAARFRNGAVPRHIVLVDDVFTTGSTLGACFKALRSVFPPPVRISVATLGYVGGA